MSLLQSRIGRLLVVLAGFALLASLIVEAHDRFSYNRMDGCKNIPMAPAITPPTTAYLWPYGAVYTCRVIGKSTPWWGETDVSFFVILETDRGPVLARVDYARLDWGRQYTTAATELEPDGFDLSAAEADRIRTAIADRGGLQPTPWIVHYGDG